MAQPSEAALTSFSLNPATLKAKRREVNEESSSQRLPVTLNATAVQPEPLAEAPDALNISCEVTFRYGTGRFASAAESATLS